MALRRLAEGRRPYQRSIDRVIAVVPLSVGEPPDGWAWDGRPSHEREQGHRLCGVFERVRRNFEPAEASAAWP